MDIDNSPYCYSLATRLKEKAVLDLLDPQKGESILDLGCGTGYFSARIAGKGSTCCGIDIDSKSISLAREYASCDFVQGPANAIPMKDNSVDKVLFSDVIEHLADDFEPLKEIARVLKDHGEVVVTTASLEGMFSGSFLHRLFHDKPGTPEYHYRDGYRTADLGRLMERAGFKVTDARYSTVFLGEIFMEMLKLIYLLLHRDFEKQADAFSISRSKLFTIYKRIVFPALYFISDMETRLLSRMFKGHIVIMKGKKA